MHSNTCNSNSYYISYLSFMERNAKKHLQKADMADKQYKLFLIII